MCRPVKFRDLQVFPFDQLKTCISKFNGCFNFRLRPLKCAFADHPLTGAIFLSFYHSTSVTPNPSQLGVC